MPGRRIRDSDVDGEDFEIHADRTPPTKRARSKLIEAEAGIDLNMDDEHGPSESEHEQEEQDDDEDNPANEAETVAMARQMASNKCAEAGVIESIELFDFMCHAHFKIELGPNLNFVVGMNGSGKSAVLTAITVCLGGKAAASGRGTSVKSLVREGASQATIIIVMRNKGPDAFMPDSYGSKIIIERKFKTDGSGSYALKSATGHKHGTRKEDLEQLCDHFGLQIDNPMNILSQDFAREFLASSTPTILYALFMKGIDITQLEADHNLLQEQIATTNTILETREAGIVSLKEQLEQAEKMYATTVNARRVHEELDELKNKMAWAHVVEAEAERDSYIPDIEAASEKLAKAHEKVGKGTIRLETIRQEIVALEAQRQSYHAAELGPLELRQHELNSQMRAGKTELETLLSDQRDVMAQMHRAKADVLACEKAVEQERRALATNEAGQRVQELERRKRSTETSLEEAIRLGDSLVPETQEFARLKEHKEDMLTGAMRRSNELKAAIAQRRERVNKLQQAQKDNSMAFGSNMGRLLNAINRATWKCKPIGPFGSTMKLKYPEWSDIVERFFGNTLNSFFVQTFEDKMKLQDLMRTTNSYSSIVFTQDDSPFHYDEPDPKFLTILRAIEWSNESVKRRLLISNRPAGELLIKDRREADELINGRNKPAHAHRAYALDARNPHRGGFCIGGGAAGSSSSSPMEPWHGPRRLTSISHGDIKEAEADVRRLEEERARAEEDVRGLRSEVSELSKELADCEAKRKKIAGRISRAQDDLSKVAEALETSELVDDGKLTGLLENLRESQKAQETLDATYTSIQAERAEIDKQQHARKEELKRIAKEVAEHNEKTSGFESQLDELKVEMAKLDSHTDHYKDRVPQYRAQMEQLERTRQAKNTEVQSMIQIAEQMCPRMEVSASTKQLHATLESKTRSLASLEKQFGGQTVAEIAIELDRAKTTYNNATADIQELQGLADMLGECLDERVQQRKLYKRHICQRTRMNFQMHLSNRSYKGRLRFDHKAQQLHTTVNPTQESAEAAEKLIAAAQSSAVAKIKRKNTAGGTNKGLSGGEKSFTTICLLLSMWDAMNCPIRALDEFDVFMDAVNRTVALAMIRKATTESADKQYILITPQDMQGVKEDKFTKIQMLNDPRTRLNGAARSA